MPTGKYMKKAFILALFVPLAMFGLFVDAKTASAQSYCYTFNTDLKVGSTGADVEALHNILTREGFSRSTLNYSYYQNQQTFTEETASLVSGFQEKYRTDILTPLGYRFGTGYVGLQTRNKLNNLYSCSGGQGGQAPTITNFVAPTQLRIGETGTWTMTASDPQNGQLYYSVQWGDESYSNPGYNSVNPLLAQSTYYSQQASFTHSYSSTGTYTVRFKVRDNQGYEAQVSATVVVSNDGGTDSSGLTLTATPNKYSYSYNEPILVALTARNNTAYEKVLNFNSGCQTSYQIGSYNSASNQICTMALTSVRIPAYGSYVWNIVHQPYTFNILNGTYTVTARIIGYGEATATITVGAGGGNTGNDIRLLSPNGGQWWPIGTYQTISWQLPNAQYFSAQGVDINLIPQSGYYPQTQNQGSTCPIGSTCPYTGNTYNNQSYSQPYYYQQPYNLVRSTYGTSYNWYVGNTTNYWTTVPAGTYIAEVCLANTTVCDRGDSIFTISR